MPAHPLARELIEALGSGGSRRVLDFGCGAGRNARALKDAGFEVVSIGDAAAADGGALETIDAIDESFDGAISTHALLHGTPHGVAERVKAIARVVSKGGYLFATFASTRDVRYGRGERIGEATVAPLDGDEVGVAHAYFDEARLRAVVEPYFRIVQLDEVDVDAIAGRWAHPTSPLRGAVHWLLCSVRR